VTVERLAEAIGSACIAMCGEHLRYLLQLGGG